MWYDLQNYRSCRPYRKPGLCMTASILGQLPDDERMLVMSLLACIVDHSTDYLNEVHHISELGGVQYFVRKRNGASPVQPGAYSHPVNIAPMLARLDIAVEAPPPSPQVDRRTSIAIPRASEAFQFTPQAIQAYRDTSELSRAEIQRRIGQALFEIWQGDRSHERTNVLDVPQLCAKWSISEDRFFDNAYILRDLGYASEGRYLESTLEQGNLFLTSPRGLAWANAGFPSLGVDGTPIVNITVHVTVQQVIQEVQQLNLSEEDKERIELLFYRFEQESQHDSPSYKPLQDLLDMATKVKDLAPLLFRFGAQHLDDIHRMSQNLPGI